MTLDTVQFKILNSRVGHTISFPSYGTTGSAGLDLVACIDQDLVLRPNTTTLIPTGIALHIGNPNYAATILPRSGLGHKHGIILGNGIGLIDSDYQGELKISCWNRSPEPFTIMANMRIAQLIIFEIHRPKWQQVTEFTKTTRGEQGFGSTGQHSKNLPTDLSTSVDTSQ